MLGRPAAHPPKKPLLVTVLKSTHLQTQRTLIEDLSEQLAAKAGTAVCNEAPIKRH